MVQLTERSFLKPEQLTKRLLVLPKFQDVIREEFDNAQLEYKDFSDYQDKYIKKNGQGYPILAKEYAEASTTNDRGWHLAPLIYNGQRYTPNSVQMPKTCKILEFIGHTHYCGFTRLDPEYGLDWHWDDDPDEQTVQHRVFWNVKTDGGAYLDVMETEKRALRRYFKENDFMIFRSKKKHRVWNDGSVPRYSLVLDVYSTVSAPIVENVVEN